MKTFLPVILVALALSTLCCSRKSETTAAKYPSTRKVDTVTNYFGTKVSDPYRWLENDTASETKSWVKNENDITFAYLDKIPYRSKIRKRLEELYNYERLSAPFREGDYYYFYKNNGLQNHSVLYRKKGEQGTPEVFLDPNTFSKDATTGLAGVFFTRDGSLAAFLISEGGSDWRKGIVIKTSDKSRIGDTLRDLKFTGLAWKGTEGFYYSSYDKPKGSELTAKTQHHKLFYHALGTNQKNDVLIFGGEQTPRRYIGAGLTEDERFLVISAANSTTGNELYAQDLHAHGGKLITLVGNLDKNHNVVENEGTRLIIQTNLNAPNGRIVEVDFSSPDVEHWKDIVPETENAMQGVSTAGGKMFVNYLQDASTLIKQFNFHGIFERNIDLPGIGSASGPGGKITDKEVYYSFTSFTYPPTIFKYSIATGTSTLYEKPKVDFRPEEYETRQVFYKSADSTKIPMFITFRKGTVLDGKNPTWLYAYGGFNISLTPGFSTSRIVWLENGGVYAQPCLRGGGEYGEKWHLAGTKLKKAKCV